MSERIYFVSDEPVGSVRYYELAMEAKFYGVEDGTGKAFRLDESPPDEWKHVAMWNDGQLSDCWCAVDADHPIHETTVPFEGGWR